jgi:uncharacterized protein YjbJ (UPF0337 family)
MNEAMLKGNWNELKGRIKAKWGDITNDDMDVIDGKADQLVGILQQRYGRSKEEAEREVEAWRRETRC